MAGIEAGISIQHVPESLDQQSGAGQQNQAHRHFADHKRSAKASVLFPLLTRAVASPSFS